VRHSHCHNPKREIGNKTTDLIREQTERVAAHVRTPLARNVFDDLCHK
jgi:hypothetical protein